MSKCICQYPVKEEGEEICLRCLGEHGLDALERYKFRKEQRQKEDDELMFIVGIAAFIMLVIMFIISDGNLFF